MKTKTTIHHGRGVANFLAQHGADVTGVVSGFDRVRLRGSLRYRYQPSFMHRYLCAAGVLLKNFSGYGREVTARARAATHAFAASAKLQRANGFTLDRAGRLSADPRYTGICPLSAVVKKCISFHRLRLLHGRMDAAG